MAEAATSEIIEDWHVNEDLTEFGDEKDGSGNLKYRYVLTVDQDGATDPNKHSLVALMMNPSGAGQPIPGTGTQRCSDNTVNGLITAYEPLGYDRITIFNSLAEIYTDSEDLHQDDFIKNLDDSQDVLYQKNYEKIQSFLNKNFSNSSEKFDLLLGFGAKSREFNWEHQLCFNRRLINYYKMLLPHVNEDSRNGDGGKAVYVSRLVKGLPGHPSNQGLRFKGTNLNSALQNKTRVKPCSDCGYVWHYLDYKSDEELQNSLPQLKHKK